MSARLPALFRDDLFFFKENGNCLQKFCIFAGVEHIIIKNMITTAIPAKSLDTFTLELPKDDTAFLKTIARKMGWKERSNRRKMSAYERSLDDECNGRINHYASSEEFFNKMGI